MFLSRNPDNARINDGRQEEGHIDKSYKARGKRLQNVFPYPLTEVHVSFYANELPLFTHYNQFLQRLDPLAHMVKPVTDSLTRKIGMRFLIPDVLHDVTEEVLENKDNYLPLFSAYIGGETGALLQNLFEEGDITVAERNKVLEAAEAFYRDSLKYVLQKMRVIEGFWKNAVGLIFVTGETLTGVT